VVDSFFDGLDRIEDELESLEDRIFDSTSSEGDAQILKDTLEIRKKLVLLRRRIVPMRDVVMGILRHEIPWVDGDTVVLFQDVLDHLLRIIDQIDVLRELLGNAVDAHLGLVSNRMDDTMKKTSSWGAILLGSTLIAGIYGMNFRDMPELGWRLGYPGALLTMALLTAVLYYYFKRRDWL
jgi:magnesium transporter